MRKEIRGRVRIADVARAAGVSKTAVSFALNSPERISAETARRIRSVASDLGYRPDPVARMLTSGATSTIGILSPQALGEVFSNPFFATFVEGVAATAEEHGLALLLISPLHGSMSKAVSRATVDGMVVLGIRGRDATVQTLHRAGVPVVSVDAPAAANQPAVEADDEAGACLAARHLAALGHRALLVLSVEPPITSDQARQAPVALRRMRGYRTGLAAFDVGLRPEQVVVTAATIEDGERTTLDAGAPRSGPDGQSEPSARRRVLSTSLVVRGSTGPVRIA
jgi:DNA-binding LacI/PurR family transcriptional regulator